MRGFLLAADAGDGTAREVAIVLGAVAPLVDVTLGRLAVDATAPRAHRHARRHARRSWRHARRRRAHRWRPARSGHGRWSCGRTSRRWTTSLRENDLDVGVAAVFNLAATRKTAHLATRANALSS